MPRLLCFVLQSDTLVFGLFATEIFTVTYIRLMAKKTRYLPFQDNDGTVTQEKNGHYATGGI